MSLLECLNVTKEYGEEPVLSSVSLSIEPGSKTALVGRNGAGKSTLVRILMGQDGDYKGTVVRAPHLTIGYVPQHIEPPPGPTAAQWLVEDVLTLRSELSRMEEKMAYAEGTELARLLERYGRSREAYEERNGDEAETEAARWMERAGLEGAAEREAARLSGGERNVLALIKALLSNPSLLILDEPGNHLDFWGLSWLEEFLKGIPAAVFLVSHNRWMIDVVAERVLELEGGRVTEYAGGYSAYRLEKLRRAAATGADWQADRKKIDRLEALVRRFEQIARARPDPAWGKRLRARRKHLEREKAAAAGKPVLDDRRIDCAFSDSLSRSDVALEVRGFSKSFGNRVLFSGASLDVLTGERVALVGRNGSGKTTFLKDLVERGTWDDRVLRIGPSMRIGYCAQDRAVFRYDRTILEEFETLGAKRDEVRKLLLKFLFRPEVLDRKIESLSGGELNRLQMARAVFLKANLLILDEPTNHLDIPGREAIEEGLADFEGTILAVSHDRYFLEKVADRVVLLEDGAFVAYEGSFSEFWRDLGAARTVVAKGVESRGQSLSRDKESERAAGKGSNRTDVDARERRDRDIQERILNLEAEKSDLERRTEGAFCRRDFAEAGRMSVALEKMNRRIEALYKEWGE